MRGDGTTQQWAKPALMGRQELLRLEAMLLRFGDELGDALDIGTIQRVAMIVRKERNKRDI